MLNYSNSAACNSMADIKMLSVSNLCKANYNSVDSLLNVGNCVFFYTVLPHKSGCLTINKMLKSILLYVRLRITQTRPLGWVLFRWQYTL